MAIVRPLNLLQSEWDLLIGLSTYKGSFYLRDAVINHNKDNLNPAIFYKRFFWLQVNGFIKVERFGSMVRPGIANITYSLSSFGKYTIEKYKPQNDALPDESIGKLDD